MNTGDLASQQAHNLQTPRPTRSVILLLIDIGLADPVVKQIMNVNHVLLLHLCYGPFYVRRLTLLEGVARRTTAALTRGQ
jgi:uncharacterized membrane protein YGL010W